MLMLGRLLQPFRSSVPRFRFSREVGTAIATASELAGIFKKAYGHKEKRIYSFYCSDYDRIIVDEWLMLIPIDDRMATRSHAVFDTIYIKNLHIINVGRG